MLLLGNSANSSKFHRVSINRRVDRLLWFKVSQLSHSLLHSLIHFALTIFSLQSSS
jgi:hypothetical protein